MVVIRADMDILRSSEVMDMRRAYREKFGEDFIYFNYADFQGIRGVAGSPAVEYREALAKDEPTRIESHRYDDFDW